MIDSRKIEDLLPELQRLANQFVNECKLNNLDVMIYSTYRDIEKQNDVYAQGRTKPGKKVTNAKGGQSYHNFRRAFDFAVKVDGKIDWDNVALYTKAGKIAMSLGLEWGGSWKSFKDYPHCQWTEGKTLADLRYEHGVTV
jgi:peptidoglycan L-alanyl-D-glutamate endopeptidase CwlK